MSGGEGAPENPYLEAIKALRACRMVLAQQMAQACSWMKVVPSLPGHEMVQVAEHLESLLEKYLLANSQGLGEEIRLERARAEKHYSLAAYDTIASLTQFQVADTDEAGHAFQSEAGHPFRFEAGQGSDVMSATWLCVPAGHIE